MGWSDNSRKLKKRKSRFGMKIKDGELSEIGELGPILITGC